jgi:hypothetical protein
MILNKTTLIIVGTIVSLFAVGSTLASIKEKLFPEHENTVSELANAYKISDDAADFVEALRIACPRTKGKTGITAGQAKLCKIGIKAINNEFVTVDRPDKDTTNTPSPTTNYKADAINAPSNDELSKNEASSKSKDGEFVNFTPSDKAEVDKQKDFVNGVKAVAESGMKIASEGVKSFKGGH